MEHKSLTKCQPSIYDGVPLDRAKREFRLLMLNIALIELDPCYTLHNFSLDGARPEFFALSYAWGDPSDTVPISVNGQSVLVTRNLQSALRHIQKVQAEHVYEGKREDKPFYIWADALCINQMSDGEKSYQVSMMMSIYETAHRLIIWLGDAEDDDSLAIDLIADFTGISGREYLPQSTERTGRDNDILSSFEDPTKEKAWTAWFKLIARPWFSRLWIIQELAAIEQPFSITMYCGNHTFLAADLFSSAIRARRAILDNLGSEMSDRVRREYAMQCLDKILLIFLIRDLYQRKKSPTDNPKLDFLYLVSSTRSSHATDPRDRIYALLGVAAGKDQRQALIPDYSKTASQVYKEFFKEFVEQNQDLLILAHSMHPSSDLPSWTPDWSYHGGLPWEYVFRYGSWPLPLASFHTQRFRPTLNRPAEFWFSDHLDIFYCKGLWIDTISTSHPLVKEKGLWEMNDKKDDAMDLMTGWLDFALEMPQENPYISINGRFEAFCRTITADKVFQSRPDERPEEFEWEDLLKSLLVQNNVTSGTERKPIPFTGEIGNICKNRRLFRTTRGHLGIGPLHLRSNDNVCLIYGGHTAFILRGNGDGFYEFIGEAYVHGLMQGEMMEGVDEGKVPQEFAIR